MRLKTLLVPVVAAVTTVALSTGPAFAGNPHFIASQTKASVSGTSLVVKFKEAGLESGSTSTIETSAHVEATYSCVNGGKKVPSDPKKTTVSADVSQSGQFTAAKNGNVTGSLTLDAPPAEEALSCPPGQKSTLFSVVYSNVTIEDLSTGAWLAIPGTYSS